MQLWDRHEKKPQSEIYKPGSGLKKYRQSAKHFIPIRTSSKYICQCWLIICSGEFICMFIILFLDRKLNKQTTPLDKAGLFSFMSYSWMTPFMKRAYENGLKPEDIPLCSALDSCDHSAQR